MNIKYKIALYLCLVIMSLKGSNSFFYNNKVNEQLVTSVNGKIIESGVDYSFVLKDKDKININQLIRLIDNKNTWDREKYKDKVSETVAQINSNKLQGFVKIVEGNDNKVYISLSETGKQKSIFGIEKRLDNFISINNLKCSRYKYVKAKCGISNISKCEENIKETLKDNNAENINKIGIQNGYSLTSFIGRGPTKKIGNELIDINCSVCRYNTGTFLIIGSPIIGTTY